MLSLERRNANKGFTLIELIVVIAIVGIVASFAVPGVRNMLLNNQLKQVAADLHYSLVLARSEAVKRNANVTLTPVSSDWTLGWTVASGGTTLRSQDAVEGLTLDSGAPTLITYNRNGRLAASVGEVRFYAAGHDHIDMRCISIALSGHPRTERDSDRNRSNGCN